MRLTKLSILQTLLNLLVIAMTTIFLTFTNSKHIWVWLQKSSDNGNFYFLCDMAAFVSDCRDISCVVFNMSQEILMVKQTCLLLRNVYWELTTLYSIILNNERNKNFENQTEKQISVFLPNDFLLFSSSSSFFFSFFFQTENYLRTYRVFQYSFLYFQITLITHRSSLWSYLQWK